MSLPKTSEVLRNTENHLESWHNTEQVNMLQQELANLSKLVRCCTYQQGVIISQVWSVVVKICTADYFCVFYRNNGSYFVHLLNKDWHEQHALKCRSHTLPLQVLECGHFWNLHYCTIIFCLVLFTLPSAEALQRFLERWNKMGELPIQILLCSCSRSKTLQCQQTLSMALHNWNLA